MINRIKSYLLASIALLMLAAPALMPASAYACKNESGNKIAQGAQDALGPGASVNCDGTDVNDNTLSKTGNQIVNIFSIIVGIAAVIMIVYAGFRYVTSGGDSGRVTSAKNALIYALIGIAVAALAQILVKFVLFQSNKIG